MNTGTCDPLRLIQSGLEQPGQIPGTMDGLWGMRTARAVKALLAANGRVASVAPTGSLPWITEAKSALERHEVRDRSWLLDWLKRDGRSLGDPPKNHGAATSWKPASAWLCRMSHFCVHWVRTTIGSGTGFCSGRRSNRSPARC
jgi:hypothetical protein